MRVQRNYVRRSYYDPIVRSIESAVPGFDMDNYSIALRNVFWSRAVQHGVGAASGFSSSDGRGGATGVIMRAFDALVALPTSRRPSSSRPFTTKAAPCGSLSQTPTAL